MKRPLLILLTAILTGCGSPSSSFEVSGPVATTTVTTEKPAEYKTGPLQCRFRSVDGRLVADVYNTTDDTIFLLGAESSVVDPDGHSHPLLSQTIGPKALVQVSLPPPRPWGSSGPVHVGLDVGDYPNGARYGYQDAGPPPIQQADHSSDPYDGPEYWDWSGNKGPVRVRLVFRCNDQPLVQQFTIKKVDR